MKHGQLSNMKSAVLAIIVILIVGTTIFQFARVGSNWASDKGFFGEEGDFEVYQPKQPTGEAGVTIGAVEALKCAIDSMQGDNGDYSYCDNGQIIDAEQDSRCSNFEGEVALHGNTCVKCQGVKEGLGETLQFWKQGTVQCEVQGFEMPQTISVAEDAINRLGDPQHLVYYESFPKGEEEQWRFSSMDGLYYSVMIGSALNVLPVAGQAAARVLRTTKTVATAAAGETAGEVAESVIRSSGRDDWWRIWAPRVAASLNAGTTDDVLQASHLATSLIKRGIVGTPDAAEDLATRLLTRKLALKAEGKSSQEIAETLSREFGGRLNPQTSQLLDEEIEWFSQPLSNELREVIQARVTLRNLFERSLIEGGTLSREAVEHLSAKSDDIMSVIDTLSPQEYTRYLSRMDTFVSPNLDDQGRILWREIMPMEQSAANALDTAAPQVVEEVVGSQSFIRSADELYENFVTGGAFTRETVSWVPVKFGSKKLFMRPAVLKTLATNVNRVAFRSRLGRYTLLTLAGMELAHQELKNEKFKPVGKDKVAFLQPGPLTKKSTFDLYANSFIGVQDGDRVRRMYFASPCKADLEIVKTTCSCEFPSGYAIEKGTGQPYNPASFEKIEGTPIYTYDSLTESEKTRLNHQCKILPGCNKKVLHEPEVATGIDELQQEMHETYFEGYDSLPSELKSEERLRDILPDEQYRLLSEHLNQFPLTFSQYQTEVDAYLAETHAEVNLFNFGNAFPPAEANVPDPWIWWVQTSTNALHEAGNQYDSESLMQTLAEKRIFYAKRNGMNYLEIDRAPREAVKECNFKGISNNPVGTVNLDWTSFTGTATTSCYLIRPETTPYEDYNDGDNYCITGDHLDPEIVSWGFQGVALAIDIAAGAVSFGAGAVVAPATGALAAGGAEFIRQSNMWPSHQELNTAAASCDGVMRKGVCYPS